MRFLMYIAGFYLARFLLITFLGHFDKKTDVAKGQLILKGLFAVFTCTKNERKDFFISALR